MPNEFSNTTFSQAPSDFFENAAQTNVELNDPSGSANSEFYDVYVCEGSVVVLLKNGQRFILTAKEIV